MVLESMVVPDSWGKHPQRMLLIGFIYATVGIFLGLWVFGKYSSLAGIFLTTIPLVVVMYRAFNDEEEKDMRICKEYILIKEHMRVLALFLYLFLGIVGAYTFWFSAFPTELGLNAFSSQMDSIKAITAGATPVGAATSQDIRFGMIIANNARVLAFCILFSFIYGAGAVFILVWNASVIGVAIGSVIRGAVGRLAQGGGGVSFIHYLIAVPGGFAYLVHGLPEIASYFIGALAGGIISVAVVCHHYRSKEFRHVVFDAVDLTVLSFLTLILAALIEVYITPIL
jgi:uncharacterized membrane protein SpoIIM required for sporulation